MTSATPTIGVKSLGQVGFRLDFDGTIVYIDPYLSDSVRQREAEDLERLIPIPLRPQQVDDADWVLITHAHRDHCDLDTLLPLASASDACRFVGPPPVRDALMGAGIPAERIHGCNHAEQIALAANLSVRATPAAHPQVETDHQGAWLYVGYLLEWQGRRLYHAGDTALTDQVLAHLSHVGQIDVAFLPVNEINYFRNRRGIIGNMSIREAFGLADELGIGCVVPTHWDMFAANQVYREEIELLYEKLAPSFALEINPTAL
jgi:L-ascorbate 6-phosphate lactonase